MAELSSCHVRLDGVSLKFRKFHGGSQGIKEAVMQLLARPVWWNDKRRPIDVSEFWGLNQLTLHLDKGDRLGILGPNGAGKSTLLKVISGIYRPTLGKLDVKGRIAPLIEIGAGFSPELTGRENAYLNGAILGISRKVMNEKLQSVIAFSELEEFIDMPVKYYSTGMYLRLAFSIATEVTPDILILDELFAGGDAAFIGRANVRLEKFVDQSQILILVAHNLEYIQQFCNRVIVLEHGQIRADGEPREMIDRYLAYSRGERDAFAPLIGVPAAVSTSVRGERRSSDGAFRMGARRLSLDDIGPSRDARRARGEVP